MERRVIGYFNQGLTDEWASLPWQGALDAAAQRDVTLLSFHGGALNDPDGFASQQNIIYDLAGDRRIDGLICWVGNLSAHLDAGAMTEFIRGFGLPSVTVEGRLPGFPVVTYGGYEGMKLAVEHLIDVHGFSRIAFLGHLTELESFHERFRAYEDVMRSRGLAVPTDFVKPWVPWNRTEEGRPVSELLSEWIRRVVRDGGVEAVIGSCDPVALWVMRALEEEGVRVPFDLAVTGFDGFTESRINTPSLTTVHPAWRELGVRAVHLMADILDGKPAPERTVTEPRLVVAQTCGCMEPSLALAGAAGPGRKAAGRSRSRIVSDEPGSAPDRAHSLLTLLRRDIEAGGDGSFLNELSLMLRATFREGRPISPWQDAISLLAAQARSRLRGPRRRRAAEYICHQARVLIGETAARCEENRKVRELERLESQLALGRRLILNFRLESILDLLAEGLPRLGVDECYLSLFEDPRPYRFPDPAPDWSRLVLAYNRDGRIPVGPAGRRFRSREIVPPSVLNADRSHRLGVNALHFQDTQIGFVVWSVQASGGALYDKLASQISSALQGMLLVRRMDAHAEIETGIVTLSASMGQLAESIESISRSVSRQNTEVEKSASSLEEMKANIGTISAISTKAAGVSRDLDGIAGESITSIKRVIDFIGHIQNKSADIVKLLSFIEGIADQTRMLAFNASIEATHAGDSGRGFAVVSKEIRALAENTDAGLKDIGAVLTGLIDTIDEAASFSSLIGGHLDKILSNSRLNADMAGRLSLAMGEQDRGAAEIVKAVMELVAITTDIKTAVQAQAQATENFKTALLDLEAVNKRNAVRESP
ncbi:MAG: substrate-binding domain-containing protein [Spirochaetales bacterium]|nr:substrate-binding domain-containing protein [Spirochaetales bacterium]